jgi:hypothetical protein
MLFKKNLGSIAPNVPAVYDVLRLRIRALRSKDQQPQNVADKNRIKGVSPTAVFCSPSRRQAAKHIQTCYALVLPYYPYSLLFVLKN